MKYYLLSLLLLPVLVYGQAISPPMISHQSGFYTDEFYLKITHPDPSVTILYTLDGSEPKIENLTGKVWNYKKQYPTNPGDPIGDLLQDTIWTYEYVDSILVRDQSSKQDKYADISASYYTNEWHNSMAKPDSVNVFKGIVLKAVGYKNGVYSKAITRNYFISPEGGDRYTLPVTCLNIDPEKFFSYENGLNVPGILFDEWRDQNPVQPIDIWSPANFRASGSDSEIELNFTYLVDGHQVLNHGSGLRLHGNGSRFLPNRSYRLYAKSGYGASNFEYPFFDNYSENKFKRIILRNSGNDSQKTMFRDAFIQQASKKLNYDIQEYQPSILFINGEYFGLYNIRERFDDKYFEQLYNIDVDELDFLENSGGIQEGDDLSYNALRDYLNNTTLDSEENYNHVAKLVDIENYTDYFITQIFIGNEDWPQNNNEYWRKKVPYTPNAPYGHDGRWRWVMKDLDLSFGIWDESKVEYDNLNRVSTLSATDTELNKTTLIFRRLLENADYKINFVNRYCDILNTTYKSELLVSKINEIKGKIAPEIQEFTTRWSPQNQQFLTVHSYPQWETNVDEMIYFANNRAYWAKSHIQNKFDAGDEIDVTVEVSDASEGHVKLNTIDLQVGTDGVSSTSPYPWSGIYFKNVPITLKAIPKEGHVFTHWSGDISSTLDEITVNLEDDIYIKANFVACPSEEVVLTSLPDLCQNGASHVLVEGIPAGGTYSIEGINVTNFDPSLGTQTVIYLYEDPNGCIDSDTLTVIVHPVPVIDAGEDWFICAGEQVSLQGSGDAVSYLWNNGVTDSASFIPDVNNEYIVTGADVNGCKNTDTVRVTIYPLPLVDAGTDLFACAEKQVTLGGAGDAVSYSWNNGVTDNASFIPSDVNNEYIVTGTDVNGCENTDTVTVTVYPLPLVNAGTNLFVCMATHITLTASGDGISYSWNNGVTDGIPFIPSMLTGEYIVTGTDTNGCENTDKVIVTVNPLPNAFITQTGDMLTASSGATSYQWVNCETNTSISGATDRSFMVPESGYYAVAIENQFGCNDTSVCLYVDFVGIDQIEVLNDIKVYPNPTSDKLFISFSSPITEYSVLTIVDLQGKTIHSETLTSNIQQYEIEVSHLVSGVYLINIGDKYIRFVKN